MKWLVILTIIFQSGFVCGQNKLPYPNEAEAISFVKWLTTTYWDSFDMTESLSPSMRCTNKSYFIQDTTSDYSRRFSGQLLPYYSTSEIDYFISQIDSFNQEYLDTNDQLHPNFNEINYDTLSKEQFIQFLLKESARIQKDTLLTYIYDYQWNYKFINSNFVIGNTENQDSKTSLFSPHTINTLSYPIFSPDKTTVIFDISYFCGPLCAWGCTYVFKKTDNGWEKWLKIREWVS